MNKGARKSKLLLQVLIKFLLSWALWGALFSCSDIPDKNTNKKEDVNNNKVPVLFYELVGSKASDRLEYNLYNVLNMMSDYIKTDIIFVEDKRAINNHNELRKETCLYHINLEMFYKYVKCTSYLNNENGSCDEIYDNVQIKEKVDRCVNGELSSMLEKKQEEKIALNTQGRFPLLVINQKIYEAAGLREVDYLRAICDQLPAKPILCSNIRQQERQNIIILSDKRCEECEAFSLAALTMLRKMYENLSHTMIYYQDKQGKEMYDIISSHIPLLPAMCFSSAVDKDGQYFWMKEHLIEINDYYCMKDSATRYNPVKNRREEKGMSLK